MQETISSQEFKSITLLGTTFHKLRVQELIDYIIQSSQISKKTVVGHVNVRGINFACDLPWYRKFLNQSDLVFCDGFGILLGAKCCGHTLKSEHRMTCPDYIEDLIRACESNNISIYLLAGKPGITDKAIKKLIKIAPNLKIQGHHGYFEKTGVENDAVIERINQFKPDILYIGFGMPTQERWILENLPQINARVFLPLGACLDFYTGSVKRGPRWMTDRGMEWISRLFVEPHRLWDRYIIGNTIFFVRILFSLLRNR